MSKVPEPAEIVPEELREYYHAAVRDFSEALSLAMRGREHTLIGVRLQGGVPSIVQGQWTKKIRKDREDA